MPILIAKKELYLANSGSGWGLYNHPDCGVAQEDMDLSILFNHKAVSQITNIADKLKEFYQVVTDFKNGEFDKYIDKFQQWKVDDEDKFDPYHELEFILFTDSYDELPLDISQYLEMVHSVSINSERKRKFDEIFDDLIGRKIKKYFRVVDPNSGEVTMVCRDDVPSDILKELEQKNEIARDMQSIEVEHCFDNYNEWISFIKQAITNRESFFEILSSLEYQTTA